jgi:guanine deaminase
MKKEVDKKFLRLALDQAKESLKNGGFPAGAVIVKNGNVISRGLSLGNKLNDPTEHSETSAIRKACEKLKTTNLKGATLYASLQPCLMCFSAAYWSGISKIVYGTRKNKVPKECYEGSNDTSKINKNNLRKIEMVFVPDFEKESIQLVNKWLNK